MSNAPEESIAHRFDIFTSPRLWQARPRAQRRGGTAGCCSDDAQVSSVSTPSSRWSSGATAGRTGVQLYPHRFRHHLNHTGLNRGGAEGDVMQLRPWRGRQDRAVNIGARLCPRLSRPLRRRYSNRRVLRFSRVRPLVPNHASPNKRGGPVCQRGDDVGEVLGSVGNGSRGGMRMAGIRGPSSSQACRLGFAPIA
jgi:hypothetical protein